MLNTDKYELLALWLAGQVYELVINEYKAKCTVKCKFNVIRSKKALVRIKSIPSPS